MARIENQPKVFLTQEESEVLKKAQDIFYNLGDGDENGDIFNQCNGYESEWCWLETFIDRLVNISEVEVG